jgi:predicted enzyme related to lactoylglutathione lyase
VKPTIEEAQMAEFTKHEVGTFSWADLATSDLDAAIALYSDLFGWQVEKEDVPGGGVYAMCRKNGKDVVGAGPQREEEQGMPPHWNVYVTVDDAEQAAKQAESLGGTILAPAFDVVDYGRMAVIADPTGAVFNVWESKKNIGAQVLGEQGALSWFEVLTNDTDKAGAFYSELFGYTLEPFGTDGSYTVFKRGEEQIAGMMKAPMEGMPNYWGLYFTADDVDVVTDKVKAAGGQAMMEPTDMPEVGRLAVLTDPQGASFGVINGS